LLVSPENEAENPQEFVAVSEAARLCRVTRFTIRNWILRKKLKAARTAGRHHRILKSDLLRFMKEMNVRSVQRSQKTTLVPFCWEYAQTNRLSGHSCKQCLVFKARVNRCFLTVSRFGADEIRCEYDCSKCAYMDRFFHAEKTVFSRMGAENGETVKAAPAVRHGEEEKKEFLNEGLRKSGHYFAVLRNVLKGKNSKH
jgi:excisionase family DNA binding protein